MYLEKELLYADDIEDILSYRVLWEWHNPQF